MKQTKNLPQRPSSMESHRDLFWALFFLSGTLHPSVLHHSCCNCSCDWPTVRLPTNESAHKVYFASFKWPFFFTFTDGRLRHAFSWKWWWTLLIGPASDFQKIDQMCHYKFDWGWLDEALPDNGGNSPLVRLGDFIQKVDAAGKVLCQWCGNTNYANRGRAAVFDHVKTKKHSDLYADQLGRDCRGWV